MVFIVPLILKLLFVRYFISLSWYAHALSSYLCENRKATHRTRICSPNILPNTARAASFSASLSAVTVRAQNLVQTEAHETVIYEQRSQPLHTNLNTESRWILFIYWHAIARPWSTWKFMKVCVKPMRVYTVRQIWNVADSFEVRYL